MGAMCVAMVGERGGEQSLLCEDEQSRRFRARLNQCFRALPRPLREWIVGGGYRRAAMCFDRLARQRQCLISEVRPQRLKAPFVVDHVQPGARRSRLIWSLLTDRTNKPLFPRSPRVARCHQAGGLLRL